MAEKTAPSEKTQSSYTIKDAMKVTEDIFNLSKDKQYKVGAFVHGLIFALEFAQLSYGVPQQHIADIKRDCRRYLKDMAIQQKQEPAP